MARRRHLTSIIDVSSVKRARCELYFTDAGFYPRNIGGRCTRGAKGGGPQLFDQLKKVRIQQTHNQGSRLLILTDFDFICY